MAVDICVLKELLNLIKKKTIKEFSLIFLYLSETVPWFPCRDCDSCLPNSLRTVVLIYSFLSLDVMHIACMVCLK